MKIHPSISRSAKFGNLKFPTRKDYAKYFIENQIVKTEDEIWNNETYVNIIHRHWHSEGRNGCIFALLAARRADEFGWQDYVITDSIDEIERSKLKQEVRNQIQKAINNPNCEILSLLFSKVTSDNDLVRMIQQLILVENIILTEENISNDMVTLALRVPLDHGKVLSWLMAFGPYKFFPQTRQSPVTEIAIRVKEKPVIQFHRLSKDAEAAHLADLPLDYTDEVMEKTWENTINKTRLILGGEPDSFSAAKTTFSLPKKIWLF